MIHNSLKASSIQYWCIVPAAGAGSRFGGDFPKQYHQLLNQTVIEHTLKCLLTCAHLNRVIVCVAENDVYWQGLPVFKDPRIQIVIGGITRQHSVLNGLMTLQNEAQESDWILVHDAARPCVKLEDIYSLIDQLHEHPVGGILAVPAHDTVKQVDNKLNIVNTIPRDQIWLAATPQMFRFRVLFDSLNQLTANNRLVTDEAQAVELLGFASKIVVGNPGNIKITTSNDLALAEYYLQY